jgi:hypothetical protein
MHSDTTIGRRVGALVIPYAENDLAVLALSKKGAIVIVPFSWHVVRVFAAFVAGYGVPANMIWNGPVPWS